MLKKFSFLIGLIGVILGLVGNGILIFSSDISDTLRMFTVAAIPFSIIALVGVLISNKIKSLARVMMFLGAISNTPVSVYSGIYGNIMICMLCAIAAIMLLVAGIVQVTE